MSYMACPGCAEPLYPTDDRRDSTFCNNPDCPKSKGGKPYPPEMLPRPMRSPRARAMRRAFKGIA